MTISVIPGPLSMTPTVNTTTADFAEPVQAGSLLIGCVAHALSGTAPSTGPAGWTGLLQPAGFGHMAMFYKADAAAGEPPAVFGTGGSGANMRAVVAEVRGLPGAQLDQWTGTEATGGGGGSIVTVTAPSPDTQPGNLIVCMFFWNGGAASPVTGTNIRDSSGTARPASVAAKDDGELVAAIKFAVTYLVAGSPLGTATNQGTGSIGVFASGRGLMASFKSAGEEPPPAGGILARVGSQWVPAVPRGRTTTGWAPARIWDGTGWRPPR